MTDDADYVTIDYEQEMPEALRHHLDSLANSCAYYYDALADRGLDEGLCSDLVLSWHDAKVGAWRDGQISKIPNGGSYGASERSTRFGGQSGQQASG